MPSSTEYWNQIASSQAVRNAGWITPEELLAPLVELDVSSHTELIRVLSALDKPLQIAAIRVFEILRLRTAGRALFDCWLSTDSNVSFAAGHALQKVRSHQAYRELIKYIWSEPTPSNAEQACYILSWSRDDTLLEPLLAIYEGKRVPFEVRAQAAEGFANLLAHVDRRTKPYHLVLPALLHGLNDPSPEVRFWTCFALGNMRAKQALPQLERVAAEDDAVCPTWWLVKEEAEDAICHILNRPTPSRRRLSGCASGWEPPTARLAF